MSVDAREHANKLRNRLNQIGIDQPKNENATQATISTGLFKPPIPKALRPELDISESHILHQENENLKKGYENQTYYLQRAEETGLAWHQCVKSKEQYTEWVMTTPEMAKILLQFNNNPRSRISMADAEAYARDMKSDNWGQTHESLGLDLRHEIYDGQHRLTAITIAGKTVLMLITFNCTPKARMHNDMGKKRTQSEKLDITLQNEIGKKLVTTANSMIRGVTGKSRVTTSELESFCAKYGHIIDYVVKMTPGQPAAVRAAFCKGVILYGEEKIEPLIYRFSNMLFQSENDIARKLYENILNMKKLSNRIDQRRAYTLTVKAIRFHVTGKDVKRKTLQTKSENVKDLFEWNTTDWTIK